MLLALSLLFVSSNTQAATGSLTLTGPTFTGPPGFTSSSNWIEATTFNSDGVYTWQIKDVTGNALLTSFDLLGYTGPGREDFNLDLIQFGPGMTESWLPGQIHTFTTQTNIIQLPEPGTILVALPLLLIARRRRKLDRP